VDEGEIKDHEYLSDIALGEGQRREFKRAIENPESLAGEIVAFANSDGGVLFIGIDDSGQPAGVDVDSTCQLLANICRDRCIPPISPVMNQFQVSGKDVVVLQVKPELNGQKPYRTRGGRFYIRVGSDKKDATGRELIRIAQVAGQLHYDESPVLGTRISDLSLEAFSAFHQMQFGLPFDEQLAQSGVKPAALLRNLRLMHDLDGEEALSVAGLLIFGKDPQRFMPQSRLSAVAFAGGDEDSDILDRREISGRLPQIIDDARLFLERNVRMPARENGFGREDVPLYDRKALGEAVVNAVAHRDYSLSGSQIRMFVFSDRIEIRSPGLLPNSVTLDNIKLGVHAERNRAIATILTQQGYMSAIGTGIPRLIIRLSRSISGRDPEFVVVGEELRVIIWSRH